MKGASRESTAMDSVEQLVAEHLRLARAIAVEYSNVPGATPDELRAQAMTALLAAARAYDPKKGDFPPFAGRAIRNALNSLYSKQVRYVRVHEFSLDASTREGHSSGHGKGTHVAVDDALPVALRARLAESDAVLRKILTSLPRRSRQVVQRLSEGWSYSELGQELGMTKQGAHKLACAVLQGLRESLEAQGFSGLDSKGFLKSKSRG